MRDEVAAQSVRRTIYEVWRASPAPVLGIAATSLLTGLAGVATAWVIASVIDLVASANQVSDAATFAFVAAYALAATASAVAPLVAQHLQNVVVRRFTLHAQERLFKKLNSIVGVSHFENPDVQDAIQLASAGVQTTASGVTDAIQQLLRTITGIGGYSIILLIVNPVLAGLALASAIPRAYTNFRVMRMHYMSAEQTQRDQRRISYLSFLMTDAVSIKEIGTLGIGGFLRERLLQRQRLIHKQQQVADRKELRWTTWAEILMVVCAAVSLYSSINQALAGAITVGQLGLVLGGFAAIQTSSVGAAFGASALYRARLYDIGMQSVISLQSTVRIPFDHSVRESDIGDGRSTWSEVKTPTTSVPEGLVVDNVWHRYHSSLPWVLKGASLRVEPGEVLAVVGPNGCGKSTLVKLLGRLYDPSEGKISLQGRDSASIGIDEWRRLVGIAYQDFVTYEFTIRDSLALGDVGRRLDDEWIESMARHVGLNDQINRFPERYETEISLGMADGVGVQMSGGQLQKLALARVLGRHSPLLVLDEPTSALDVSAELQFGRMIRETRHGLITIVISHRLRTMQMADRIAVMSDGRIVEVGTHVELLTSGGAYARLYRSVLQ